VAVIRESQLSTGDAASLAEHFVAPLGRRWLHVQAVAARAVELSAVLPEDERGALVSAAWLHDIGYSPEIGHTRFDPLDGARYLREQQWPERVVNLVAHHSGARFEAIERGLADDLAAFPFGESPAHDALATADLTTGPGGEPLTYDQRVTDILDRYPERDAVHRTWVKAAPILRGAVQRTEELLVAKQRDTDQA
jgi:hypothetical protein